MQRSDDLLEPSHACLDLDKDDLTRPLELDIHGPATRSRDRSFDGRPPAPVSASEEPFDHPRMGRVEQERRSLRIELDPEVRSETRRRPRPHLNAHTFLALLQLADHGPIDADRPCNGRLGHAVSRPELAEIIPEPPKRPAHLPITLVDRVSPNRHLRSRARAGFVSYRTTDRPYRAVFGAFTRESNDCVS